MDVLFTPSNYLFPFSWAEVFEKPQPIEFDIGCGDGGFLCEAARARPDHNFFGTERLLGRARKIERRARREELRNVRVLRLESHYAIRYLVPAGSVACFHLYFPDPFPKKKQQKRRLVTPEFAGAAARALEPGGRFWVRTDHADYFERIVEVLRGADLLDDWGESDESGYIATDFEKDFRREGRTVYRAAFRKRRP